MERTTTVRGFRVTAEMGNGYDLERQLAIAERRYAQARDAADNARAEWRSHVTQPGVHAEALRAARGQYEWALTHSEKLRALVEQLEERLEG